MGTSKKTFTSKPTICSVKDFEAVLGARPSRPLVGRPFTVWPIAAMLVSAVPVESASPSASRYGEGSLVDVEHLLREVATHLPRSLGEVSIEELVMDGAAEMLPKRNKSGNNLTTPEAHGTDAAEEALAQPQPMDAEPSSDPVQGAEEIT